jgi:uncharacterized protein (DUF2236 family)
LVLSLAAAPDARQRRRHRELGTAFLRVGQGASGSGGVQAFDATVSAERLLDNGTATRAVTADDLERELAAVSAAAAGPSEGVFGPKSVTWMIDREAATFLGAGRALLLQLAHPWVAAGIAEHSRTLADPVGRFHRTFEIVFGMVFGTLDGALAVARRLHRRHAAVRGSMPETVGPFPAGSSYLANDLAALTWVHATLAETALVAHELVRPPLPEPERERYWAECRLFAALFGVPARGLPADWAGFVSYNAAMHRSPVLTVSPARARSPPSCSGRGCLAAGPRVVRGRDRAPAAGARARGLRPPLRPRPAPDRRARHRYRPEALPGPASPGSFRRPVPGGGGTLGRTTARPRGTPAQPGLDRTGNPALTSLGSWGRSPARNR